MDPLLLSLALAVIPPASNGVQNRQPQLASSKSMVALVYGSGHSVMFSKSESRGETFMSPLAIAEMPVLALGRHRGPRVVFSGNTILVSAIGGTALATGPHAHGLPSDGNLFVWRSTDGGKTWSKPVTVNDSAGSAREGLHAIASDDDGHVAAVWLDLRAQGTRLYGAVSSDGGLTWSRNFKIYESPNGTICQCCHPSLLFLGRREFAVMFRNALGGSRDMYVTRINNGDIVAAPQKAGKGSWKINACPMDGGGLALSSGKVLSAWRRETDLFLAVEGQAETRIGAGKDVALTATADRIFVVWTDQDGIQSWSSGHAERLSQSGAFPSVTALADGTALAAWEQNGSVYLRRLQ